MVFLQVGELVEIDVLKGRPLPFDPEDVNVKKVSGQTISRKPASMNGDAALKSSYQSLISNTSSQLDNQVKPEQQPASTVAQRRFDRQDSIGRASLASASVASGPSSPGRYARISIIRGNKGFGFTIADSQYGQRIKDVIDKQRCRGLQEGDLIVEINNKVVRNLDHIDVVAALKSCPENQAAEFVVQRGGKALSLSFLFV